jgi:hypothetical protein
MFSQGLHQACQALVPLILGCKCRYLCTAQPQGAQASTQHASCTTLSRNHAL